MRILLVRLQKGRQEVAMFGDGWTQNNAWEPGGSPFTQDQDVFRLCRKSTGAISRTTWQTLKAKTLPTNNKNKTSHLYDCQIAHAGLQGVRFWESQ